MRGELDVPDFLRRAAEAEVITIAEMIAVTRELRANPEAPLPAELAAPLERVRLFWMESPSLMLH